MTDDLRTGHGWDTCIVVNEERVVLGRLGRKAIAADSDESVEEAMTEDPSTVRPSIGADALLDRMRERNLTSFLVTTPDGQLVGLAPPRRAGGLNGEGSLSHARLKR
jgi:Mg/Co/Ni transporter MgtE